MGRRPRVAPLPAAVLLVVTAAAVALVAYELSPRELHLSAPHGARLREGGLREGRVSNRGELVAKLFAEHYAPLHLEPGSLDRVAERN